MHSISRRGRMCGAAVVVIRCCPLLLASWLAAGLVSSSESVNHLSMLWCSIVEPQLGWASCGALCGRHCILWWLCVVRLVILNWLPSSRLPVVCEWRGGECQRGSTCGGACIVLYLRSSLLLGGSMAYQVLELLIDGAICLSALSACAQLGLDL